MIISSLLDTDLYKFTMMQVVLHHFPGAQVEYRFKCRTPGIDLVPCIGEIRDEIGELCKLRFQEHELEYLRSMRFIKSDFVDFLQLFQMNQKYISVSPAAQANGEIEIIVKGPWLHTILFEIPVLSLINEIYFRRNVASPDLEEGRARLKGKMALIAGVPGLTDCKVADYGTRRRFSRAWQEEVIGVLRDQLGVQFAGTSNVDLALRYNLIPLGTMAHEYLQACQSLGPRLRDSQTFAFEMWAKEYRGDLGIALSDVYGFDAFLRDFDMYFCKLFDGVRHDSGDPFAWGERMIAHYTKNRVDAQTKTLIFSDGLDFPRVIELYQRFQSRVRLAFGVGTNLTNDLGYTPMQIVIKMVRCNGQPVAKLSDTPAKNMCDDEAYLAYLRQVFEIPAPVARPLLRIELANMIDTKEARQRILARIRHAQHCPPEATVAEQAEIKAYLDAHPRGPQQRAPADLIEQFVERAGRMSSTIERLSCAAQVPDAVARYLNNHSIGLQIVVTEEIEALPWDAAGVTAERRLIEEADLTAAGGVFAAIADTGTLAFLSSPKTPASNNLLPENHIVVVRENQIVGAMEDVFDRIRSEPGSLPRALNFVSGPSRTGDIEQTIVLGAHGPYRVHILLIKQ